MGIRGEEYGREAQGQDNHQNLTLRVSHGKGALMKAEVHNSLQDVYTGHLLGASRLPRCGGELILNLMGCGATIDIHL